ncbi:MAG: hypothetical protein WD207_09810 [Xanthobacteraceae bacterium]
MFALDARSERVAALLLALLMAATRIHHFGVGTIAPDASTAVFFLAGLLLANPWWFAAFTVEAILLDAVALGLIGVADACMTLGYWLLFVGYLALWYAGSRARTAEKLDLFAGCRIFCLAAGAVVVFFILSNVGYYYGGGFDESMGASEYISRVSRYFSFYLATTLGYVAAGIAAFLIATRLFARDRFVAR